MTPAQIAQVLEGARQQLIGLGIASPTAEQIGFTLMGGIVPTPLGGTPVAGALRPNPPSVAAQMQQANAAGGTTTSATPAAPRLRRHGQRRRSGCHHAARDQLGQRPARSHALPDPCPECSSSGRARRATA